MKKFITKLLSIFITALIITTELAVNVYAESSNPFAATVTDSPEPPHIYVVYTDEDGWEYYDSDAFVKDYENGIFVQSVKKTELKVALKKSYQHWRNVYSDLYGEAKAKVIYVTGKTVLYTETGNKTVLVKGSQSNDLIKYINKTIKENREEKARLKKVTDKIISKADKYTDTYDRLKVIHDEICELAEYDYTYKQGSGTKLLLEGKGVCNAYAEAYSYVCKQAGLDVIYITGLANGEHGWELHAWNMAKVDGKWYYVDVCFDDSEFGGYGHFNFLMGEKSMLISHCITSAKYPKASKSDYLTEKKAVSLNGNIAVWGEVGKTYYISIPEGYSEYKLKWSLSNDNAEIVSYSLKNYPGYHEDPFGNKVTVIDTGIEIKLKKVGDVIVRCEISSGKTAVIATKQLKIEETYDPQLGYKNTDASSQARTIFSVANPKVYLGLNVPIDVSCFADIEPGTKVTSSNKNRVNVTKTTDRYTITALSGSAYITVTNGSESNKFYVVACKKYSKPSYLDIKLSKSSLKAGDTFTVSVSSDRNKADELTWMFSNNNIKLVKELDEKGNVTLKLKAVSSGTTIIRCITSSGFVVSYTVTIK
jgi:Uncharacterized protein involved in cytokinesis, contains TGc (transglutaminase/protease-like) domain